MRAHLHICILLLLVSLASGVAHGQLGDTTFVEYSPTLIDSTAYKQSVKEVTYTNTKQKLLPRKFEQKKKKKKKAKEKEDRSTSDLSFLNGGLIKIIMYGLVGALVLLILWLLLGNIKLQQKPKTVTTEVADDYIEDIEAVDTEAGLRAALAAADYRTACRMVFLKALQQLQADGQIKWKPEKTNRHYLRELSASTHIDTFRPLANTYEKVWYGNKPLSYDDLKNYLQKATQITPITIALHE